MKESDLFEPVKKFLLQSGCSKVYGEVLNFDVLGISGAANVIVELKTSLSFKLIDQAIDRLRNGHYVYIAIPKRKNFIPRCVTKILRDNKIGLLEVHKYTYGEDIEYNVSVSIPARYNRLANDMRKYSFNIRDHIKPYHETQIGGVKGGEAVTDYSVMIDNIKLFMKRKDWVTANEILDHCEVYYSNPKPSLITTLKAEWNKSWCEIKVENGERYYRYIR